MVVCLVTCNCADRPVWEVMAQLRAAESDHRIPLYFRNLARIAADHLEQLSRPAGVVRSGS